MNEQILLGQLMGKLDAVHDDVKATKLKVTELGENQSAIEERLKSGANHFARVDDSVEELQKRKCPKFPSPKLVYAIIAIGFTALGILIKTN